MRVTEYVTKTYSFLDDNGRRIDIVTYGPGRDISITLVDRDLGNTTRTLSQADTVTLGQTLIRAAQHVQESQ